MSANIQWLYHYTSLDALNLILESKLRKDEKYVVKLGQGTYLTLLPPDTWTDTKLLGHTYGATMSAGKTKKDVRYYIKFQAQSIDGKARLLLRKKSLCDIYECESDVSLESYSVGKRAKGKIEWECDAEVDMCTLISKLKKLPTRFTVGKLIGVGGCARVYDCVEDSELVIKRVVEEPNLPPNIKKELQIILNEIDVFKQLEHPRVVRYFGSYVTDSEVCLVLQKVSGGNLRNHLATYGAFGEDRCRKYTIQVLAGLAYLHEQKVIHRDLKGANILLDESGDVKLCDFGLSKLMGESTKHITVNSFVGTPHWMAPEVIRGRHYGRKCDIWSLGCTVVEMLTTKPPWPVLESMQVYFKTGSGEQPEYTLPDDISKHARDFLELCFTIDPAERPTVADLMQHRFVLGTSISPCT